MWFMNEDKLKFVKHSFDRGAHKPCATHSLQWFTNLLRYRVPGRHNIIKQKLFFDLCVT